MEQSEQKSQIQGFWTFNYFFVCKSTANVITLNVIDFYFKNQVLEKKKKSFEF